MLRRLLLAVVASALVGCVPAYTPPAVAPEREPEAVNVSSGRVWDELVEWFARRNLPIRTIDRSSGLLVAEPMIVAGSFQERLPYADCGKKGYVELAPTNAIYNVLVRGDSTRATVRVNVRFSHRSQDFGSFECESKGVWERELETVIRERARQ